jgi:peroxiredoxin Q/BCP
MLRNAAVAGLALTLTTAAAAAQDAPKVGDLAPDFTVQMVTAANPVPTPFKLSEHRGKTIVIAFFPKARTKG